MLAGSVLLGGYALYGRVATPRAEPGRGLAAAPECVVWAWQRPEDLRSLDPAVAGVGYWAGTVWLSGGHVEVVARSQPLATRAASWRMPVVRIAVRPTSRPALDDAQRARVLEMILALTPGVPPALQLDFDARSSERAFYRGLLFDLREALDDRTALSITALASWCLADSWLAGLPIDEAVPMLFRMGPESASIRGYLNAGHGFAAPVCRTSYGVSTDEPRPELRGDRRVYLFHPQPWEPETVRAQLASCGAHDGATRAADREVG